jgi:hypothetical protein
MPTRECANSVILESLLNNLILVAITVTSSLFGLQSLGRVTRAKQFLSETERYVVFFQV